MSEIFVLGLNGAVLAPGYDEIISSCYAVVAPKKKFSLFSNLCDTIIEIAPVKEMVRQLRLALQHGNVAVLASGDPLFYGIGRTLLNSFSQEQLCFYPAVSAMQLACARFKIPWDDLHLFSLHGRDDQGAVGRILAHNKVMLFTDGQNSPDRIAMSLLNRLEVMGRSDQAENIRVSVAENLCLDNERLTRGTLAEIAAQQFAPLNMMLVEQPLVERKADSPLFGLQEKEITHSRGLITKSEVRAVILHCLRLPARGVFWDVGGGSGSISVEVARLCPALQVFTVEQKEEGQQNIRKNIHDFQLYTMELVCGRAPEALALLPDPDRIFIGGSGGALGAIIKECGLRLRPGGIMAASAVLAATAEQAPDLMRANGLEVEVRRVAVTRFPGEQEKEQHFNPITIITGKKC